MLVTDARRARMPLLDLVTEATAGGVDAVYLRDVAGSIADLALTTRSLRARIGDEVTLLVNGGPKAALATGCGLHLRERDMTPAAARAVFGPQVPIGRSVHAPEGAAAAPGADYLLAGHVYASPSKPGLQPLGLAGLAQIVAVAPCPVIAIGGITPDRVTEVIRAGARGVAVIGAIVEADDPRAAARALRVAVDRALQHHQEEATMSSDISAAMDTTTIEIVVNGKPVSVSAGATIHDFLAGKRMTDAMAIVERNGEIVPRGAYGHTPLRAGDRLEVVHAVGGG
jgi:thiazole tautomerase (transcriptional regulator TenI)